MTDRNCTRLFLLTVKECLVIVVLCVLGLLLVASSALAQNLACSPWKPMTGDTITCQCVDMAAPDDWRIGWGLGDATALPALLIWVDMTKGEPSTGIFVMFDQQIDADMCPQPVGVVFDNGGDGTIWSGCGKDNWVAILSRNDDGTFDQDYELAFLRHLAENKYDRLTFIVVVGPNLVKAEISAKGFQEAAKAAIAEYEKVRPKKTSKV